MYTYVHVYSIDHGKFTFSCHLFKWNKNGIEQVIGYNIYRSKGKYCIKMVVKCKLVVCI